MTRRLRLRSLVWNILSLFMSIPMRHSGVSFLRDPSYYLTQGKVVYLANWSGTRGWIENKHFVDCIIAGPLVALREESDPPEIVDCQFHDPLILTKGYPVRRLVKCSFKSCVFKNVIFSYGVPGT